MIQQSSETLDAEIDGILAAKRNTRRRLRIARRLAIVGLPPIAFWLLLVLLA